MKFFTNKSIWTKIIIVLIFIILFEFVVTKPTMASNEIEFGGKLLTPIFSLVVTLGDTIMDVMHSSIMGADTVLLDFDLGSTIWERIGNALVWVAAAALAIVAFAITGGLLSALLVGVAVGYYGQCQVKNATSDKVSRGSNFI